MEKEIATQESIAMSILKDYKNANRRMFIIILVILVMWFATIGYLVWLLNDIQVIDETTTTQEVTDFDTINGNVINSGDNNGKN